MASEDLIIKHAMGEGPGESAPVGPEPPAIKPPAEEPLPDVLPVLPLGDLVVFPGMVAPLVINTDAIRYIQMKRNYAEVHLTNGAVFTSRITMEELELIDVRGIPPGHAARAEEELGEEGDVEADEDEHAPDDAPLVAVHAPEHLGPPVVDAADEGDEGGAHHDVVEVGDHEVGVVEVHVG